MEELNSSEASVRDGSGPNAQAEDSRGDRIFSATIGILIAIVTIVGAVVGWRSALAGTEAGNADDAGIIAALNAQESSTISDIVSNQHRTSYLEYWLNKALLDEIAGDGTLDNLTEEQAAQVIREITEAADLATASKQFFPAQYLNADGSYNATRERAELIAEAAQQRDLNAQQHFDEANQWRDKSIAFMAVLVLLGISLWLLASAETIEHRARFVLAAGGTILLIVGIGAAVAIEMNVPLADVYNAGWLLFYVTVALVIVGLIVAVVTGRRNAQPGGQGDRGSLFNRAAILLIATVALMGAVVAYLQADAGSRGDTAIRRAQLQAAEALGVQTTGEARTNFQYAGAAQAYEELTVRANAASEAGDDRAAERFLALQDSVGELAELMRAPYFDDAVDDAPNLAAFQADMYVARGATLSESSAQGGNLENAWEEKSNTYIIHLTLLATALALLGLGLTFAGVVRPLFMFVGTALVLVTVVWGAITFFAPVPEIPQQAIDAYGRGVGASYRGDHKAAIAAFTESLNAAPGYGTALYARGSAYAEDGDLEAAIRDYETARAAGKNDANMAWDLGYSYYLTGKFDNAVAAYNDALAIDPRLVWVRLDLALAYLALGRTQEAQAEYQKGKDQITTQVADAKAAGLEPPPDSLYYLDAAADDLESLVWELDDTTGSRPGAPSKSAIQNIDAVLQVAEQEFTALKSLAVALEFTGKPPAGPVSATFSELEFGIPTEDDDFDITETFPSDTKDVWIIYSYEGMRDGQQVLWKVYVNGEEYPEYRTALAWDKGESGEASQAITDDFAYGSTYFFEAGEYVVELYVDSQLVQRGFFTVEEGTP